MPMTDIKSKENKIGRIQAVLTDLDGTLLGEDKSISSEMEALVRKLESKGIFFSFITGRPKYATERFAKQLRLQTPVVSCNGAILFHGDQTVTRHSFRLAGLKHILNEACRQGITVLYYAGDVEYAMEHTDYIKKRNLTGRSYPVRAIEDQEWETMEADKVNLMAAGHEEAFSELYPYLEMIKNEYSITSYGMDGCEIVAAGINKCQGMKELSAYLGIPVETMMVVGDNNNDIEMLKAAGFGAAVGNASEAAKAAADYVCSGERTKGVIEAVSRFVLEDGII